MYNRKDYYCNNLASTVLTPTLVPLDFDLQICAALCRNLVTVVSRFFAELSTRISAFDDGDCGLMLSAQTVRE